MEEQNTVVSAPVDAGQVVETQSPETTAPSHTESSPSPVENQAVDAPKGDSDNVGQAIKAEVARREAQLKKQYEEQIKAAETYQRNLDRAARYHGFENHDAYMKALDQAERQREIEREAERLGVDPSVIKEYIEPVKSQLTEMQKKVQEYEQAERVRQVEAEIARLSAANPDFKQREEQVFTLAMERGYTLEDAYIILTHNERIERARQEAQQEAIRKLDQNATTSPGALGADSPEEKSGYAAMTPSERRAFRDRVKRGQATI